MSVHKQVVRILGSVIEEKKSFHPHKIVFAVSEEAALIKECVFGVLRWLHTIEYFIGKIVDRPFKKKERAVHYILCIGIFQLLHTRIPAYAVVSSAVTACVELNKPWARGVVNYGLRSFIRRKSALLAEQAESIEAQYAHPTWLISALQVAWPEDWEAILCANNAKPPLWLRVNTAQVAVETYAKQLTQANLPHVFSSELTSACRVINPVSTKKLPGFATGLVSVQDLASQYVLGLLEVRRGYRVLDACAAPGGKASHLLERHPDIDKLTVIDNVAERMQQITENMHRLCLPTEKVQSVVADARETHAWWDGVFFDRILVDAPCSATGVIRRHPDIKILRTPAAVREICQVQKELLTRLWGTLKPGGKLLYTTCSILPEENEQLIAWLAQSLPGCEAESVYVPGGQVRSYGTQLLPQTEGADGFYYARIKKEG